MPRPRTPPRAVEALFRRLLRLSTPSAEFIVGDLRESYAAVRARTSVPAAVLWYCMAATRLAVRLRWERSRSMRRAASAVRPSHTRRPGSGDLMRVELKQALRFLLRRPGFSGAIVLTVALAIAATTVAYAVVDGVLLERMPFAEPDELVVIWERNIPRDVRTNVVSPANFMAWREQATSFEDIAAAISTSATVTGEGEPERVGTVVASPALFQLLGAQPMVGRLYGESDDATDAARVVVLSESYWRRRFGADPAVVGGTLQLNALPAIIVGVLPDRFDVPISANFNGPGTHELWLPPRFPEEARTASGRFLQVFGRLRPGVTVDGARAEMQTIAARLREEFPDRQTGWDVTLLTLRDEVVGDIRALVLIVFGAVSLVLLIACGNVANLLLTRASARQQEMAVRSALGAGRGRLVRQLLLESGLLSVVGGACGTVLAFWAIRSLVAAAPDLPRIETIGLDASVVGFALLATVGTALLFGLAPALHIAAGDVAGWLKERGGNSDRRGGNHLRAGLVVVQVSLSLILLVGAGLLVRSFANRLAAGVGFDMDRLLTAELEPRGEAYGRTEGGAFFEELVERVAAITGVEQASAITFPPLAGGGSATSIWPLDRPTPAAGEHPVADVRWIHRDYHRTLGVPLLAGRYFDVTDRADVPLRVVINESGARQLWPGENAVGKHIAMPWGDTLRAEVIGVVADVLFNGPDTELRPMLYWDHRQFRTFQQMTVIARVSRDPASVVSGLRAAVHEIDPQLPVYSIRTVDELYGDVLARPRFATVALSLFAALGLLLAGIGIYGVIAYVTQQRSREIGIRLALGAGRGEVQRMVLKQGAVLIVVALVIGAAGALAVTRLLQGLVFDISTTDPATFGAMATLIAAIALLACWIPARRASTIDPVEAIRYEG